MAVIVSVPRQSRFQLSTVTHDAGQLVDRVRGNFVYETQICSADRITFYAHHKFRTTEL